MQDSVPVTFADTVPGVAWHKIKQNCTILAYCKHISSTIPSFRYMDFHSKLAQHFKGIVARDLSMKEFHTFNTKTSLAETLLVPSPLSE
jgi:hypothetical protein